MYEEIIEGLKILSSFEKSGRTYGVRAEHDIIWAGPNFEDPKTGKVNIPDRVLNKMTKLSWHFDDDVNSFAYFV